MSNATVIQRMFAILDSFDVRSITPYDFERAIEFHMDALERIDSAAIHSARKLTADVVRAHFMEGEEEFGNEGDEQLAIKALRAFIETLPS